MLKLESISKTFAPRTPRQLNVLKDINLEIERGEFAVLLGNNGSGKSTLLKIIAGSLRPDTGKIALNGVDLTNLAAYERSKYLFQVHQARENNLAANLTVSEIFMLAMTSSRSYFQILRTRKFEGRIKKLLGTLKQALESRVNDQIWSLSGGEHQLVTILVAAEMIRHSSTSGNLLLLDEHVAHLDPASSDTVMSLTSELVQKYSLTTLMVTHNIQIASSYGNRVLILKDGRITFDKKYDQSIARDPQVLLRLIS